MATATPKPEGLAPGRLTNVVLDRAGVWLLAMFVLCPMLWVLGYSLSYSLGGVGSFSTGWGLSYWRAGLAGGGVVASMALSIYVAALVTLFAAGLALASLLLLPSLRQQPLAMGMLCVWMGTPGAVTALLVYQIFSGGGLVSRLAFQMGWLESPTQFPSLVNDAWGIGMIVASTCGMFPLLLLYFSQLWTTIRADQWCALAESLGATRTQARVQVALPLLLRRGRAMIVLTFLLVLGSYETPLLLGRQSPQMISVFTQRHAGRFDLSQKPQAYVLATLYFALCFVLLAVYLRGRRPHAE